jgi:hypothetical protein
MRTRAVIVAIGSALALFGALWLTCSLVASLRFPVAGYGVWNLVAGLLLVATGAGLILRGRRFGASE